MKVLISGVMMATLVATCANAAITVEKRKAACEKSGDKVWVEAAQTCIPKNPCLDDKFKDSYCDYRFKDISVSEVLHAIGIVGRLKYKGMNCTDLNSSYIACEVYVTDKDSKATYRVFPFASLNEENANIAKPGFFEGVCIAWGGEYIADGAFSPACKMYGSRDELKAKCEKLSGVLGVSASFQTPNNGEFRCVFEF